MIPIPEASIVTSAPSSSLPPSISISISVTVSVIANRGGQIWNVPIHSQAIAAVSGFLIDPGNRPAKELD